MRTTRTTRAEFLKAAGEIADALDTTWRTEKLNEAAVRQAIVLRLLQAAGFDLWNPLEVAPEPANLNGGRCDLELRLAGKARCVIELKRLDAPLATKEIVQAISYASNHGIRWAIATNGRTWLLFDTHLADLQATERLVFELKLGGRDHDQAAQRLYSLLSRAAWAAGSTQRLVMAWRGLPAVWRLHGDGFERELRGSEAQVTVGRDSGNAIVLADGSVSRQHAVFEFQNQMLCITDVGATNPVLIDGRALEPHKRVRVPDGAEITIGRFRLRAAERSKLEPLRPLSGV